MEYKTEEYNFESIHGYQFSINSAVTLFFTVTVELLYYKKRLNSILNAFRGNNNNCILIIKNPISNVAIDWFL